MKHALVTVNLVVLAVVMTATLLPTASRAGASAPTLGSLGLTLSEVPLDETYSQVINLTGLPVTSPMVPAAVFGLPDVKVIEFTLPPESGLVLYEIANLYDRVNLNYAIYISGTLVYVSGGQDDANYSEVQPRRMQPILVRPNTTLRIEAVKSGGSAPHQLLIQAGVVPAADL